MFYGLLWFLSLVCFVAEEAMEREKRLEFEARFGSRIVLGEVGGKEEGLGKEKKEIRKQAWAQ